MSISGVASSTPSYATAQATPRAAATELSAEALAQLQKLKARDTEVRQHEQAHLSAAGGLALSGASYTYQRGPDGVNYAVGGEVQIDTSPGATPEETLAKARTISAAALAPAEPSGADRAVAAQAQQLASQARAELAAQQGADAGQGGQSAGQGAASPQQRALERAYGSAPSAAPALDVYA